MNTKDTIGKTPPYNTLHHPLNVLVLLLFVIPFICVC